MKNNMKTVCVYHSRDLGGMMSAAIVKKWFLDTYEHNTSYSEDVEGTIRLGNGEELYFLGWDYGQEIPDLSEYDKVIMCDVSFPYRVMEGLHFKLRNNFVWIDHHVSAIKEIQSEEHIIAHFDRGYLFKDLKLQPKEARMCGLRNAKFSACELTWFYYNGNKNMPEIVRLLGMYDSFRYKGTDEEQKVLEFQYGARHFISNYKEAYNWLTGFGSEQGKVDAILDLGIFIYQHLCTEAKQIYKKAFKVKFPSMYADGESFFRELNFLCVNHERFNPINFGIDYHKEGYDGFACFWYKDGKWSFSLYNDNGEVDCSKIAKQFSGGGHKVASGFVIDNIEVFLKQHKV